MSDRVLDWLLETDQPAVRLRTLVELEGRPMSDPEVRASRAAIRTEGWVAEILAARDPSGGWHDGSSQYRPKYTSTNWRMLVLSDLGVSRDDPVIAAACERWMQGFATRGGGLGGNATGMPHLCVAANMARALARLGYADDRRVRRTMEWLVEVADPKGGWSCFGSGRNLDSWEPLSAFAAYPRARWTPEMAACVGRGAEFFLDRELHRQGSRYEPWYRSHYPVHYYYDLLVGLDVLTSLGHGADPRLAHALAWLRGRRRRDGRWNLDAVHPDVEGALARWAATHPKDRPTPWAVEPAGAPSKMVTLTARLVLARVDAARRPGRETS